MLLQMQWQNFMDLNRTFSVWLIAIIGLIFGFLIGTTSIKVENYNRGWESKEMQVKAELKTILEEGYIYPDFYGYKLIPRKDGGFYLCGKR